MYDDYIYCQNILKKGDGYFAKKDIEKDTLIFSENIKVCISTNKNDNLLWLIYLTYQNKNLKIKFLSSFVPHYLDNYFISSDKIKSILNKIKTKKLKLFFESLDIEEVKFAYEKIKRNSFKCDGKFFIAFKGTKFNHACNANIDYYFNSRINVLSFYSNQKILSGEELTIQYVNSLNAKNYLYDTYGFICDCNTCKNFQDIFP